MSDMQLGCLWGGVRISGRGFAKRGFGRTPPGYGPDMGIRRKLDYSGQCPIYRPTEGRNGLIEQ